MDNKLYVSSADVPDEGETNPEVKDNDIEELKETIKNLGKELIIVKAQCGKWAHRYQECREILFHMIENQKG